MSAARAAQKTAIWLFIAAGSVFAIVIAVGTSRGPTDEVQGSDLAFPGLILAAAVIAQVISIVSSERASNIEKKYGRH